MAANQKELAKLAGVSAGTVSNVISGSTRVSENSRQKVLEAIRVLNYQPNFIARSLKTNRTHTLGIVVPDITIAFFPKIIRGAECAARERGYFLDRPRFRGQSAARGRHDRPAAGTARRGHSAGYGERQRVVFRTICAP